MSDGLLLRNADPNADGAACAAIYAPAITEGNASFELEPPGPVEMAERIERTSIRFPWLVAVLDGAVAGYAYATEHRARAAYRWTVETSVYIDAARHRRGLGRALYGALLPLLRDQGFYMACAGITLPNDASLGLHQAMGYELIGHYRDIGFKNGTWHTVAWLQRPLRDAVPGETPAEPGPPGRLP
jgi:L-amino acid N-acyltransferase YncA